MDGIGTICCAQSHYSQNHGIIVVDKPTGFTSFDVVAKLRGILQTRKIGHGGTLDPMATGVLPVFVGTAAKAVDLAPCQDKAYEASLLFGLSTDTGDITGAVLKSTDVNITGDMITGVIPQFLGQQSQLPPMYSAVKINGKPLYKYARDGKEVQRKPRAIEIYDIKLLCEEKPNQFISREENGDEPTGFAPIKRTSGYSQFRLSVACSKGTYIRTLAEDIGKALGVPATLAALRRTKSGCFTQSDAIGLDTIQKAKDKGELASIFTPTEVLFASLPVLQVDNAGLARMHNGTLIYRTGMPKGRYRAMLGSQFLGLAVVDTEGTAKAEKLFVRNPANM